MKPSIRLRLAGVDDAPTIARIHVDTWRAAYRGLVPDEFLQNMNYSQREEYTRAALIAHLEETYMVEDGDEAVGILTIGLCRDSDLPAGSCGEIWGIYLVSERWRQGLGTWLVDEAERKLQARGYNKVTLWVFEGNSAARRFYEAVGYTPDGTQKVMERIGGLRAVRLIKTLPEKTSGGIEAE